jgi:2-oxoisovalerate dehydrogenase E1 component
MTNTDEMETTVDWLHVAELMLQSRAMDELEENELVPKQEVLYQFSARGHELGQIVLGSFINHRYDGVSAYYRSRPLMLSLGLSPEDAMAAPMAKSGGYSDGRDIGVVCNMPSKNGPTVLPMAGDVGSQYTPGVGWAQGIEYRRNQLEEEEYEQAISVIPGGDGSVASNGFLSALTIATTQNLPLLFYIEDNSYGISVPGDFQTPGGNIAKNLDSFNNIHILDGDGTDPEETRDLLSQSVSYVRQRKGPVLVHLTMPRLNGHSYQDNQAYKGDKKIAAEKKNDPLVKLKNYVLSNEITEDEWDELQKKTWKEVEDASKKALKRAAPDSSRTTKYLFAETKPDGKEDLQAQGGLAPDDFQYPDVTTKPSEGNRRINMAEAIRQTLETELKTNSKLLVFGEDVGAKGGVHAVTMGLQSKFGDRRVFDTSLSEEGIIGRAVGMAYTGLKPVAEIQFRKYADPATEQLKNCGTIRWRTANRFAAPIVVRMPGGFAKCGDPWHSMCDEAFFAHAIGWQIVIPRNARDAVGLLRSAMRSQNPTIFFEHRTLLDAKYARTPYPGDQFVAPIGKADKLQEGDDVTIVTWGAMCQRCKQAAENGNINADILDLRSIVPWDKKAVLESVKKTNRCLIVHEDAKTAGFGAEIAAIIMSEAFTLLDAPVERLAMPDIPVPHNVELMDSVMPGVDDITDALEKLVDY